MNDINALLHKSVCLQIASKMLQAWSLLILDWQIIFKKTPQNYVTSEGAVLVLGETTRKGGHGLSKRPLHWELNTKSYIV